MTQAANYNKLFSNLVLELRLWFWFYVTKDLFSANITLFLRLIFRWSTVQRCILFPTEYYLIKNHILIVKQLLCDTTSIWVNFQNLSPWFQDNCRRGKLSPIPKTNPYPNPNPIPNQMAIFFRGNCPVSFPHNPSLKHFMNKKWNLMK